VILKYDGNRETWNRTFFNLIFTESLGLPHRLIYLLKRPYAFRRLAPALVKR
jgi:hypothetical protein